MSPSLAFKKAHIPNRRFQKSTYSRLKRMVIGSHFNIERFRRMLNWYFLGIPFKLSQQRSRATWKMCFLKGRVASPEQSFQKSTFSKCNTPPLTQNAAWQGRLGRNKEKGSPKRAFLAGMPQPQGGGGRGARDAGSGWLQFQLRALEPRVCAFRIPLGQRSVIVPKGVLKSSLRLNRPRRYRCSRSACSLPSSAP